MAESISSYRTKSKSGSRKPKAIQVIMEGGIIQNIIGIPKGYAVEVLDYDDDLYMNNPDVHESEDGSLYHLSTWRSDDV